MGLERKPLLVFRDRERVGFSTMDLEREREGERVGFLAMELEREREIAWRISKREREREFGKYELGKIFD